MSKLFGGGSKSSSHLENVQPFNINTSGLSTSSGGRRVNVRSKPERNKLFTSLSESFSGQADVLDRLLPQLKPGFGALTRSRIGSVQDARRSAIGNLRENLQRRRVLGSSFGQDAVTRAEAEFAKEEAEVKARSFLEELDATVKLLDLRTTSAANASQVLIDKMNFEADVATQLASQATTVMAQNAQVQAQLAAQQASDKGSLFGTILGIGASFIPGAGPAAAGAAGSGFTSSAGLGLSAANL